MGFRSIYIHTTILGMLYIWSSESASCDELCFKGNKMEEYRFLKDPPEDFSCMICAKVLNEPQVTDCCGQHFCAVCLEQWLKKQAKKTCPHCRSERFSYMRYLPLKRKINALQVYCPFEIQGCKFITTVGHVKAHKAGCGFAQVLCKLGCGVTLHRKFLAWHCKNQCPKRKVKCQYCRKEDHFEVISGNHVNTCEEYPLKCPRGCGQGSPIKRKDLVCHAEVCPLEQVPCTFREAGCDVLVLRKDLNSHLESSIQEHLMKMMTSHMELKRKHRELEADNRKLKVEHSNLKLEHDELKLSLSEHEALKKECGRLSSLVENLTLAEPVRLDDYNHCFTFLITSSDGWVSPPFYVLDGYKFCIKHTKIMASLMLLKGEFDDRLKWPINLEYELEIICHGIAVPAQPQPHDTTVLQFYLTGSKTDFSRAGSSRTLANIQIPFKLLLTKELLEYTVKLTKLQKCPLCGSPTPDISYGGIIVRITLSCRNCGATLQ